MSATPWHEQRLELATGDFGMVTLTERSELQLALDSDVARSSEQIGAESDAFGECRHVMRVRRAAAPDHHLFSVCLFASALCDSLPHVFTVKLFSTSKIFFTVISKYL